MKECLFNEGMIEGLRIANVYVQKELFKNPSSKKLLRILVEVEKAIQQEKTNIQLQRLNDK